MAMKEGFRMFDMFKKYGIENFFFASIDVLYPDSYPCEVNIGGVFQMGETGYGYSTVLLKEGDKFIDLNNPSFKITTTRDPNKTSCVISWMDSFSHYFIPNESKKKHLQKELLWLNQEFMLRITARIIRSIWKIKNWCKKIPGDLNSDLVL